MCQVLHVRVFLSDKGLSERWGDQDEGRKGVLDVEVETVANGDGVGLVDVEKIFVFGLGISLGIAPAFKSGWKGGDSVGEFS